MRDYSKLRYSDRRSQTIQKLGGKCAICGTQEDLEVDHINPRSKSFNLFTTLRNLKDFWDEVEKCQLLCQIHHREKTTREQSNEHGSGLTGKHNCRCVLCKPLKQAYDRESYKRKKMKQIILMLSILLLTPTANAACWTATSPFKMGSTPVNEFVVSYEWNIRGRNLNQTITTDVPFIVISNVGLANDPVQVTVVQIDSFGQRSPVSPKSDFIFSYPPFGADLNGDGKVTQNEDYLGKPYGTGMSATFGCKSCAGMTQ